MDQQIEANRIAYIYFLPPGTSVGVYKKIDDQIKSIHKNNCNRLKFYIINPDISKEKANASYRRYSTSKINLLQLTKMVMSKFRIIERCIPEIENFKTLILRYPGSDFTGISFYRKYNVITELHAVIISELKMKYQAATTFTDRIIKKLRILLESRLFVRIISKSKGIISVSTDVIDEVIKKMPSKSMPTTVIGNGILTDNQKHSGFLPYNNQRLVLTFVGSRPAEQQNGLPRLISSLDLDTNQGKVLINIVGSMEEKDKINTKYIELNYLGKRTSSEIDTILQHTNLGVCQLAFYRKNLHNTSTIKVPEYTLKGIPFIIGYHDPGLKDNPDLKYWYHVPNDQSPIQLEELITFSSEMTHNREKVIEEMQSFAKSNLSWESRLHQYIEFTDACTKFNNNI